METLKEILHQVRRMDYESEHAHSAYDAEQLVAGLIRDYDHYRARLGEFTARLAPGGDGVGGSTEPSEETPLTKP